MAAGGVGVRIKSYKQTTPPPTADLFADTAATLPPAEAADPAEVFAESAQPPPADPEPAIAELTDHEPVASLPTLTAVAEAEPLPTHTPATEPPPAQTVVPVAEAEPAMPTPVAEAPMPPAPPLTTNRRPAAAKKPATKTGPSKRGRKSLKQVSAEADLIEIPVDEVLFSKQYYTMGEVSEMFRVNQSLLRFWETEFDILQPRKNKKGDRYFRPIDIKNLHLIYHLLRQKKYTIEGAKEFLKKNKKAEERFEVIQRLQQIRAFLLEWKAQL